MYEIKCRKPMSSTGSPFLSDRWVREVIATIEQAKSRDPGVRSLASEFSLSWSYVIRHLPQSLEEEYVSDKLLIYVKVDRGTVRHFTLGTEPPKGTAPDFTVESSYDTAKKIFLGELNPAAAFIRRHVKVSPLMKLYADPAFTAKSLTAINVLLRVAQKVPTVFQEPLVQPAS